jgi:Nuf2 family
LSVPLSEEDLQRPTPQRVQMVYEAFLDLLMGYTRESFNANVRACESEVDYFVPTRKSLLMEGRLPELHRTNDFPQTTVSLRRAMLTQGGANECCRHFGLFYPRPD